MYFQKPENALKRAEELISVGHKRDALVTLHAIITSKRHFRTWQKSLEQLMFKYVDLCVEMGKSRLARDGMHQYRNTCSQVPNSLESVLKYLVRRAEEAAETAQDRAASLLSDEKSSTKDSAGDHAKSASSAQKEPNLAVLAKKPGADSFAGDAADEEENAAAAAAVDQDNGDDDDDDEGDDVDEQELAVEDYATVLLGRVSGDDRQARAERQHVAPWLKFLWEAYRLVLDIVRNNNKLEALYHGTAQAAFLFCKRFERKNEFRRLSDILRNHLSSLQQPPPAHFSEAQIANMVALEAADTVQMHLETRFAQLTVATDLELWQESFKSVEDIHGLVKLSQKPPKAHLMALFFEKLAQIFLVGQNPLFHTYAYFKFFAIARSQSQVVSAENLQKMATKLLLAALAVPLPPRRTAEAAAAAAALAHDHEVERVKNTKIALLLGFVSVPRRASLLAELEARQVPLQAAAPARLLHAALAQDNDPLQYAERVRQHLAACVAGDPDLAEYAPGIERVARIRLMQQLSCVYESMSLDKFAQLALGAEAGRAAVAVGGEGGSDPSAMVELERAVIEGARGGHVDVSLDHRRMAVFFGANGASSGQLRHVLRSVHGRLAEAAQMAAAAAGSDAPPARTVRDRDQLLELAEAEHQRLLKRRTLIEHKKQVEERERDAERRRAEEQAARERQEKEDADRRRIEAEVQRRKQARLERENREIAVREATDWAKHVVGTEVDDAAAVEKDPQKFMQDKIERLTKEKREMEARLLDLTKSMDYMERARRKEELPLLEAEYERQQVEDQQYAEQQMAARSQAHRDQHQRDLKEKARLARVSPAAAAYAEDKQKERARLLASLAEKREARVAELRDKLRAEWLERKRLAARRRAEEARAKRLAEERQRVEEEQMRREREKRLAEEQAAAALRQDADAAREREQRVRDDSAWRDRDGRPTDDDGPRPGDRAPVDDGAWRSVGGGRDRDRDRDRYGDRDRPRDRDRLGGGRDDRDRDRPPAARGGAAEPYRPPMSRDAGRSSDEPWRPQRGGRDDRDEPRRGGFDGPPRRFGDGGDRGPPRRYGGGDDRGGPPRFGGGGDRDRGGAPRFGGGDRDRGGPPRFGGGDRDRGGPPRFGGGDRDRDRGSDRPQSDRRRERW